MECDPKPEAPSWSEVAQAITPGRYRHYKGGEYEVIGVARHSETFSEVVVYHPAGAVEDVWVRPVKMFVEHVNIDGRIEPRFRFLG